jgi:hypothetical protein
LKQPVHTPQNKKAVIGSYALVEPRERFTPMFGLAAPLASGL